MSVQNVNCSKGKEKGQLVKSVTRGYASFGGNVRIWPFCHSHLEEAEGFSFRLLIAKKFAHLHPRAPPPEEFCRFAGIGGCSGGQFPGQTVRKTLVQAIKHWEI